MTRQIHPCTYGGGSACERQGGSGEAAHSVGYTHPMPTLQELGRPAGDSVHPVQKARAVHYLPELEVFFDDTFSKSVLGVSLDTMIHATEVVKKSLYDFDLDSPDGVLKLLELLPIMDREILVDIAGEIWPGYPAEDSDFKLLRLEIKGYLMDYLDGHGKEEATGEGPQTESEGLGDSSGAEESPQEGTSEAGTGGSTETGTSLQGASGSKGASAEGPSNIESTPR